MDLAAYDILQEEALANEPPQSGEGESSLNNDLQDAYKAFTASPWGAKIGGFWGNVVKQSESVYTQASKELAEVGEDATKGFADLRETIMNRTRSLSLNAGPEEETKDGEDTPTTSRAGPSGDVSNDSETVLSRLRTEAAKRLKDLQQAEDAADEALLQFGANVRDFFRDAISVAPPDGSEQGSTVLFESKDSDGKRVIHASRFEAQIHVIHTSVESMLSDPPGTEYEEWVKDFDAEKKTDDISADLEKYPELRTTMEALVPDKVAYADFWKRYYFLRHGIETAESRRRDLLKAAAAEDEVAWDDDDSEEEDASRDTQKTASVGSSTTINPPAAKDLLKPVDNRTSNDDKSQADSEASYDVVGGHSGLPSQAASSPKEAKKDEESDEDWE